MRLGIVQAVGVSRSGLRRVTVAVGILLVVLACGACGRPVPKISVPSTASPAGSGSSGPEKTLTPPKVSIAEDAQFFTYVTEADSTLGTYERNQGNVALRALLTDGSGFCALLQRGGGVDNALLTVAAGARSNESQTHLPLSVTTFNTIEAVALLTLCPSDQKLLSPADQAKIRSLGVDLAQGSS